MKEQAVALELPYVIMDNQFSVTADINQLGNLENKLQDSV